MASAFAHAGVAIIFLARRAASRAASTFLCALHHALSAALTLSVFSTRLFRRAEFTLSGFSLCHFLVAAVALSLFSDCHFRRNAAMRFLFCRCHSVIRARCLPGFALRHATAHAEAHDLQ